MKKNKTIIWIYIGLTVLSIVLFILALKCESNTVIQTILLSFSINIFASLIIIFCVDLNVEKRENTNEKNNDKQRILSYHKNIEAILVAYKLAFNQLTIPLEKRVIDSKIQTIDCKNINCGFNLSDIDMYSPNVIIYGELGSDALETYNVVYLKTIHTFENMFTACDFKNYPALGIAVTSIINISLQPYGLEGIIDLKTDERAKEILLEMIAEYDGDPFEDISNKKYDGNMLIFPLFLYRHLYLMCQAINEYCEEIKNLEEE